MKKLTKAVLAKVVPGGRLNRTMGTVLLVAASCPLAACGEATEADLLEIESTSQGITANAAALGCPNTDRVTLKSYYGSYCGPAAGPHMEWMTCGDYWVYDDLRVWALDDGPNRIALQVLKETGYAKYVSATNGGGGGIWNNRQYLGSWEMFTVGIAPGYTDRYYIQTNDGVHFVTAEHGGGDVMNANRTAIGPWETFQVLCR